MYSALKNMKAINCPCLRAYWYIYYREIFSIWWVWNGVRVKIIYGMSIDWEKIVFWPCQIFRALVCMIAVRWRKSEGTVAYVYVCAAVGRRIFHQIHVQLISQWQSKTNMSFFTSLKIQVKIKWTEELITIHKGKFFLFIKCFNYSPTTIYKIHILQKWSHWTNLH